MGSVVNVGSIVRSERVSGDEENGWAVSEYSGESLGVKCFGEQVTKWTSGCVV
jgi:hypothetical protein